MHTILIKDAIIVSDGIEENANILIENRIIRKISTDIISEENVDTIIDAKGLTIIPGIIDDQVHFREPGLTHKGDIFSESRAAAAGGITSFMEMPNTTPSTVNVKLLQQKLDIAESNSVINYSFFIGATNDNIEDIKNIDPNYIAGVKMFLGSSTGNLLVDNNTSISEILTASPIIVAAHCEDDETINRNLDTFKQKFGEDIPIMHHPDIRSEDACYKSSSNAVRIAKETGGHLHIFHITTEKELSLLSSKKIGDKNITAEVCVHHLWFNDKDYEKFGTKIKWNPAIKKESDRLALIQALKDGKIDVVATDHAPHTEEEKNNIYTKAPSGGPLVQHSLLVMLELAYQKYFTIKDVVKWMCHNPASLYSIENRGFIKEGYYADLVLIDTTSKTKVTKDSLLYKCGWSPFEGTEFHNKIHSTIVNGSHVYKNGKIIENKVAMELKFNRKH